MKKSMIIHVGLHKTGSTFLQEKVFPHFSDYTHLSRPYTQHNYAFNKLQYGDESLYKEEEVRSELYKINASKIILSDESFSGKPLGFNYINRTIIARRLKSLFPEAKIILFIRGQEKILLSHYNQWVKGYTAGYRRIDEFIWYPGKSSYNEYERYNEECELDNLYYNTNRLYLHLDAFLYYELILLYKKLFHNVYVFLYEDLNKNPGDIIFKLEEILREKLSDNNIVNYKEKVNISLSSKELHKKLISNKINILVKNEKIAGVIGLIIYGLTKKHYNYEEQYLKDIVPYYKENNRKILEDFPEIGIQNFPKDYLY